MPDQPRARLHLRVFLISLFPYFLISLALHHRPYLYTIVDGLPVGYPYMFGALPNSRALWQWEHPQLSVRMLVRGQIGNAAAVITGNRTTPLPER